jgi:hypothetical protein
VIEATGEVNKLSCIFTHEIIKIEQCHTTLPGPSLHDTSQQKLGSDWYNYISARQKQTYTSL